MSRVTPPVTKLTHAVRRISSSSHAGHPTSLLESHSSKYLPRRVADLKVECSNRQLSATGSKSELVERLTAYDLTRSHSTTGGHRPAPSASSAATTVYRTLPLMQGFRSSAPKQAAHDSSTIDFFFFPEPPADPPKNPFSKLRVPLLPDNYNPDRSVGSAHELESIDEAVPRQEILIVASHPEDVLPAAMTEVVGNAGLDVDIGELTKVFQEKVEELTGVAEKEKGVLKEVWEGLIDDIFGKKGGKVAA